jgi:hypothetical protein
MPATPHTSWGVLPDHDLKEYTDTSCVMLSFEFTPRVKVREKTGHVAGTPTHYEGIKQVQIFQTAADINVKMEIIPNADGEAAGLANAQAGTNITLANFAAVDSGAVDPETIHGWTRDPAKLLFVKEVKRMLSPEKAPEVDLSTTYCPLVALSS